MTVHDSTIDLGANNGIAPAAIVTNRPSNSGARKRPRTNFLIAVAIGVLLSFAVTLASTAAPPPEPPNFPPAAQQRYQEWRATMQRADNAPLRKQLEMVNRFFNRHVRYETDDALWGQKDYWAAPMQTIRKGAGDCDDYVIAKYASLVQLGVPVDKLRLIYVRARLGAPGSGMTRAHMVLGYYATPTSMPLILDSLLPQIMPASQRGDLKPIFSFNSEGLWAGSSPKSRADPVARLSPWRAVLQRMRKEGFLAGNK